MRVFSCTRTVRDYFPNSSLKFTTWVSTVSSCMSDNSIMRTTRKVLFQYYKLWNRNNEAAQQWVFISSSNDVRGRENIYVWAFILTHHIFCLELQNSSTIKLKLKRLKSVFYSKNVKIKFDTWRKAEGRVRFHFT